MEYWRERACVCRWRGAVGYERDNKNNCMRFLILAASLAVLIALVTSSSVLLVGEEQEHDARTRMADMTVVLVQSFVFFLSSNVYRECEIDGKVSVIRVRVW